MELRKINKQPKTLEKIPADADLTLEPIQPAAKTSTNIHKDHRMRLKSKFLEHGLDPLTDIQKLELMLFYAIPQKDTNPLAHALLDKFGSIKNVLKADYDQLMKIKGIKSNTATFITFLNSLLNYTEKPFDQKVINSTALARAYAKRLYFNTDVEQFYIICLNHANEVITCELMNTGTTDQVNVQIRNITKIAIDNKCNKIIICHNHPLGMATASDEDLKFTYSIICSCMLNTIEVIDHIIVGRDKAISLAEQVDLELIKQRAYNNVHIPKDKKLYLYSLSADYKICKNED